MASIALFAVFHGHAHGYEMPAAVAPLLYGSGFVFSTSLLHITGVVLGQTANKTKLSFQFCDPASTLNRLREFSTEFHHKHYKVNLS